MQTLSSIQHIVSSWPSRSRKSAQALIDRYGMPHEGMDSMLVWYYNSPWKRTILYRDESTHNFPKPHHDILRQVISYRVPPSKASELTIFNGSVLVDRTRGELTAYCGSERMNILLLNLAYEIIIGEKTSDQARKALIELMGTLRFHWMDSQPAELIFEPANIGYQGANDTADPDLRGAQYLRKGSRVKSRGEESTKVPPYSHPGR